MADADLASEYSPRISVPDHEAIFARWARAAEDYRAEMLKRGKVELGLWYGDTPRQFIDLFLPDAGETAPLTMFIHGGFWRAMDPSFHSHHARGLVENGCAVAVVGYDLCPLVTIGDIIEQIRRACIFLWQRFNRGFLVSGHSAGGHLAAAMAATEWHALYPKAPPDLVSAGFGISGLFDLTPLTGLPINQDLRLSAEDARQLSPLFWPAPAGRVFDATVGDLETNAFKQQSKALAETWRKANVQISYAELPGNHFTVIDPMADPASTIVARMAELAKRVSA